MLDNIKASIERPDESKDPFVEEEDDKHYWTYNPRRYETEKYYPFCNVLVVHWIEGIAYRKGIGQVHADVFACMIHGGQLQLVVLG